MVSCAADELIRQSRCLSCIPTGLHSRIQTYLLCQWASKPSNPPFDQCLTPSDCILVSGAGTGAANGTYTLVSDGPTFALYENATDTWRIRRSKTGGWTYIYNNPFTAFFYGLFEHDNTWPCGQWVKLPAGTAPAPSVAFTPCCDPPCAPVLAMEYNISGEASIATITAGAGCGPDLGGTWQLWKNTQGGPALLDTHVIDGNPWVVNRTDDWDDADSFYAVEIGNGTSYCGTSPNSNTVISHVTEILSIEINHAPYASDVTTGIFGKGFGTNSSPPTNPTVHIGLALTVFITWNDAGSIIVKLNGSDPNLAPGNTYDVTYSDDEGRTATLVNGYSVDP